MNIIQIESKRVLGESGIVRDMELMRLGNSLIDEGNKAYFIGYYTIKGYFKVLKSGFGDIVLAVREYIENQGGVLGRDLILFNINHNDKISKEIYYEFKNQKFIIFLSDD